MAELTLKSPGVSTREIDLSGPTAISPRGIPAGIVGTAVRGPAFVPITFATFQDFISSFGATDGEKFGPLAVNAWMTNAQAGTYVRVLGIGDGKTRTTTGNNTGKITNSGFVVGDRLPQANGREGDNVYATAGSAAVGASLDNAINTTGADAADAFDITVPTSIGGPGTAIRVIIMNTIDGSESTGQIAVKKGLDDDATAAALIKAINGTVDATVSYGGGGASSTPGAEEATNLLAEAGTSGATWVKIAATTTGIVGNVALLTRDTGFEDALIVVTAMTGGADATGGKGQTYVLGCFMSESAGSTVFSDAGFSTGPGKTFPIIRGILMTPSGVVPGLSSSYYAVVNNDVAATSYSSFGATLNGGSSFGDVMTANGDQTFTMLLNGMKSSDQYSTIITASFDPKSPSYIFNVLNTDPTKIEEAGHYLYASWDVASVLAAPTGSISGSLGMYSYRSDKPSAAFLLTGSAGRNTGVASSATAIGSPNWESWEDRFSAAFSPSVISQKFGGSNLDLFKLHSLDDGSVASDSYKITIENVQASTNENNKYGTFDLLVRRFIDSDQTPIVLEKHVGLDLNPSSDRFVSRVIGDTNTFFDFDKKAGGQKLVIEGKYPNSSQFIRVETAQDLDLGRIDATALPVGFRGIHHLVTSGSSTLGQSVLGGSGSNESDTRMNYSGSGQNYNLFNTVMQLPVPMRENLQMGLSPNQTVESALTWGYQWEKKDNLSELNKNQSVDIGMYSFVKWFPDFQTSWQNTWIGDNPGAVVLSGSVRDCDRFNNNIFTLERVEVITSSVNVPADQQWSAARYRRNGTATATLTDRDGTAGIGSRFLDVTKDFAHLPSRQFLKYTFPLVGGFNGVNSFNEDKAKFLDAAVRREMDDATAQGGVSGPTVAALRKAVDVMETKSDVDIQILAIPGIRHESITDYAVESTERRFDALFIMDIEEKDEYNSYITSSEGSNVNVSNTVNRFQNRSLNTSFGAAYFPDVVLTDPATATNVQVPPSVVVLGALSLNDAIAHPWFAPAGFTRGSLKGVTESQVKFNRPNLDELYTVDINPITAFPHTPGVVIFGQKTLLAAQSALDRVNVRRLLIDVRRKVKKIANTLLFEPNRAETLARFSAAVTPILTTIQQQQGLDRFKVVIDTTTTTQADVENNTVRGKIFLQPTRSVEFIALDFVVTNAGADV